VQLSVHVGARDEASDMNASQPAAARSRTLLAHAVNLSEGGMRIRTSDPLPVGEAVTCNMLLEGQPRSLPGRVRWVKSTIEGLHEGAGIEFERLPEDDSGLLRHLVSRSTLGDQPVELYFPSMTEPVRARALTTDGGLYITAALPVLNRDTQVEFQFGGSGPRFLGRVARVAVRERGQTPHLEVELAIHAREMPRFRRYTMYGDPAREALEAESVREAQLADELQQPPLPERSVVRPIPLAPDDTPDTTGVVAIASAEAPNLDVPGAHEWPPQVTATESGPELAPVRLGLRWPRAMLFLLVALGSALPFALLGWVAMGGHHATHHAVAAVARGIAAQPVQVAVPAATPTTTPAPAPATAAPAAVEKPRPAPAADPAPAPTALADDVPEVRVEDEFTDVLVAVTGSLEGMRSTVWASPTALVVSLPSAKFATVERTYSVKAGGISRLTVTHDRGAALLRVFLDARPARHSLRMQGDRLLVHIEPKLDGPHSQSKPARRP
jgi:hypothetical protein